MLNFRQKLVAAGIWCAASLQAYAQEVDLSGFEDTGESIIEQLREDGVTIFLVEQNANQALKLADGLAYVDLAGHHRGRSTGRPA